MYKFIKSTYLDNKDFFRMHIDSLSSNYDDYFEEHIFKSKFYSIYLGDNHIGYFSIFEMKLLTHYYIPEALLKYTHEILKKIIDEFKIKLAIVTTFDESFLSVCLEQNKKVEIQAYYFKKSEIPVRKAEYSKKYFKQATNVDIDEIKRYTNDFIDKHEERIIKEQLYVLRDKHGTFLGLGIIIRHAIYQSSCSIGMYTNEKYRNKGIGRSILIHLNDICNEKELFCRPACWYYNEYSKKTLESAGFVADSRLLKIHF